MHTRSLQQTPRPCADTPRSHAELRSQAILHIALSLQQPLPSLPSTSSGASTTRDVITPRSRWAGITPKSILSPTPAAGIPPASATGPDDAPEVAAGESPDAAAPLSTDLLDLTRRLSSLQRAAEAAGRVEPLLRTPRQLRAIWAYIGAAAPLAGMSPAQQLNVARAVVMIRTRRGEVVVQEGSLGSFFYVVLAGAYAVWQQAAAGASPYGKCAPPPWPDDVRVIFAVLQHTPASAHEHGPPRGTMSRVSDDDGLLMPARCREY